MDHARFSLGRPASTLTAKHTHRQLASGEQDADADADDEDAKYPQYDEFGQTDRSKQRYTDLESQEEAK